MSRQDKSAPKFPDLLKRDFTALAPNLRWCGDITEIPTDEGKLYLATVLDLFSRKLLACPTAEHPNAELACDAIKIASAARGGRAKVNGVIFHSDRGSTYTASSFTLLYKDKLGISQSMGRVGSCFDNATAESFFSTLEHEVLSRYHFTTKAQARAVVLTWCHEFYKVKRRHSSAGRMSPNDYEKTAAIQPDDRFRTLPIWRPSLIVGALLGDACRYLIASALVLGLGIAMGYRAAGGLFGVLSAVALLLVFALGLGPVWSTLGLLMRTPGALMNMGMLVLFPLTFASNVFVDPRTLPGWLHGFVDGNPITHLVTADRALMDGTATTAQISWVLIASAALTAVFALLTMRVLRNKQ